MAGSAHPGAHLWDNGTDTLVFMQGNEPISLYCSDETDGESLRACAQVVEALYGYDQDGNVIPQLATECAPNEDLSVWTCSLREGVVFHDGSAFDANDVVATWAADGVPAPLPRTPWRYGFADRTLLATLDAAKATASSIRWTTGRHRSLSTRNCSTGWLRSS